MQARIHTITNENGTVTIHGSRMDNVVVKTRINKFENVNVIYYTVENRVTQETVSYVHIETMPNTLAKNIIPFLYEQLAHYNKSVWYVSYNDTVDYIYYV